MTEDFYSMFKLGADDKHVSATDMARIAFTAAKELQKRSEKVSAQNVALRQQLIHQGEKLNAENAMLKTQLKEQGDRLASLEKLVTNLASSESNLPINGDKLVLIK